jgi:hypothetical protein
MGYYYIERADVDVSFSSPLNPFLADLVVPATAAAAPALATLTAAGMPAIASKPSYVKSKQCGKRQLRERNIQSYNDGNEDDDATSSWKNAGQIVVLCFDALHLRLRFANVIRTLLEPTNRPQKRSPTLDGGARCWDVVETLLKRTSKTKGGFCMYIALQDKSNNMVFVRCGESISFAGFSKNQSFVSVLQLQFPNCQIVFDTIVNADAIKLEVKSRTRKEMWSGGGGSIFAAVDIVTAAESTTTEQRKYGKSAHKIVGEHKPDKRRNDHSIDALSRLKNVLLEKDANFLILVYVEMDVEATDFYSLSSAGVNLPPESIEQVLHALQSNCTGRGNLIVPCVISFIFFAFHFPLGLLQTYQSLLFLQKLSSFS